MTSGSEVAEPAPFDLIDQAGRGSSAAHLGLLDLSLAAGANGTVRQIEALVSAELWGRLAATQGAIEEKRALAGVLLTRAHFEVERGATPVAAWYENEAMRVLRELVSLGDADAAEAVEEMSPANPTADVPPIRMVDERMAAAASGDTASAAMLADQAIGFAASGQSVEIEALTVGELYSRLAATSGDASHICQLAGILQMRAAFEYRHGWTALGDGATAEATALLSHLVDLGDLSVRPWLAGLTRDASKSALSLAAQFRPTILLCIQPEGIC